MHTLASCLSAFFKINVQMALAYRADTLVNILLNLLWLGWELLGLSIIFSNTTTLGGWGLGELIALLGVFHLVNALMAALIWPNTEKFNTSVRDGTLDYTLLQPVEQHVPGHFLAHGDLAGLGPGAGGDLDRGGHPHDRRRRHAPSTWSASCSWLSPAR